MVNKVDNYVRLQLLYLSVCDTASELTEENEAQKHAPRLRLVNRLTLNTRIKYKNLKYGN